MSFCPACKQSLDQSAIKLGRCPACHAPLPARDIDAGGSAPASGDASPGNQNLRARLRKFIDRRPDAEKSAGQAAPPVAAPDSPHVENMRTLDAPPADDTARRAAETMAAPAPIVPDEGDVPDAQRITTDSDHTLAFTAGQSINELPDELSEELAAGEPDGAAATRKLTESDFTIAFVEPTPAGDARGGRPDVVDADAPRALSDSDYTFAFVEDADGEKPEDDPRATKGSGATLDVGELPPEQVEMLTGMWEKTIPPDGRPGQTIKTAEGGGATQTHLVVRPRMVRPPNQPALDGADYELLETIGKGGMGVVYAARQASIDRTVAIKMIRGEMAGDAEQRQKFLSEAVVTGDLDHPNIVPIYDLGSNESGALFYSMKRVEGTPWIKVLKKKTLSENLEILMKVADAVAFAHSRGVVHRDLKPENVMLGEFGEVLVMDWGLALLAPRFRHLGSITQSGGMGGTPAYMAPEMASGPLERIGTASDVYLMGAILYEVITGKPPHAGKDVMSCLYAVARNEIQPFGEPSELMDIALKAMSTEIDDRYPSILDFQAAIRQYFSHSESILLADRAADDLKQAHTTREYQDFARAVFGFQEALELWDGNTRAADSLRDAKATYAECAAAKGDLDLAASLLDADEPSFAQLRAEIVKAQRERDARQRRLKLLMRTAQALVAAVVLIVATAFFLIRAQRDRAVMAERDATAQRDRADVEAQNARAAEDLAEKKRDEAIVQEKRAIVESERAMAESERAKAAEGVAREQRDNAEAAKMAEAEARKHEEQLKELKEYDAYIAQIGLVSAKIDENAFGYARQLLETCPEKLRNWEWGRLMHLCRQGVQTLAEKGPVEAAAYSPDGKYVLTGSWDGNARVWDVATGKPAVAVKHGMYVHAVAWSPDGRRFATGSSDPDGQLKIWDATSGALLRTIQGHTEAVISVAFSRDGSRLLSGSYDNSARLWDTETGEELRVFRAHSHWVWSASFSPDERHIVTASEDGMAIVWSTDSDDHSPPFTGHAGPVYSAHYSPDGQYIVTAGYDNRILIWRPEQVLKFDYGSLAAGGRGTQTKYGVLSGHTAPVRCAKFSPDGATMLSASHDNTVKLWELKFGACIQTLRGHAGWVRSCAFSPDGKSVLSAGYDHQAKIWNPQSYEEVRTIHGHDEPLLGAAFSPDGRRIVTASRDRTAKVWEIDAVGSGTTLSEGHAFLVSTVVFSPDAQRIYTGACDDTVRVWDAMKGSQLVAFEQTGREGIFALSPDGTRLLTGGEEGHAKLWDAQSGKLLRELVGHRAGITAAAISPDGRLLFTGDGLGRGRIWDAATGNELQRLAEHTQRITAARFLPGGKQLLTASSDRTVGHWDVASGKELTAQVLKHPDSVMALGVSGDGKIAVTSCADEQLRIWQIDTARPTRVIKTPGYKVSSVEISSDGRRALAACSDNRVRLWDLTTGAQVQNAQANAGGEGLINTRGNPVWSAVFSPDGLHIATAGGRDAKLWQVDNGREVNRFSPHGVVSCASFSPNGERTATCSWDGTIKVWNSATGAAELKFTASPDEYVNSIEFSPDGTRLLSASDDQTARIWDATSGKQIVSLPVEGAAGHAAGVHSARFSADGLRVVTASKDKTARVWDAATGQTLAVLAGHEWQVFSAALSRDGKQVITGSEDNSVRIWDAATGKQLHRLDGHTAAVTFVAFSPDGSRAASGGSESAVKLWDVREGKEILHLRQHTQAVTSVAFSPDGRTLLTSSLDGTAVLWPTVDWLKPAKLTALSPR